MEDNILFQSNLIFDLPTYREFNRGYSLAAPMSVLSRIILILCTFYILLGMGKLINIYTYMIILLLWGIIGAVNWLANRKGSIHYKRQLSNNFGKPPAHDYHFTDDAILSAMGDQVLPGGILYTQIRRVVETKNLLVLVLRYRQAILVSKQNLQGGTQEEFLAFLRSKCTSWKRGKVSKCTLGKVLNWIWACSIVITLLAAICNFPGIEVAARLNGSVINTMSYRQVAEKLEPLGITGSDEAMYEELDENYSVYYRGLDYGYYHKSADLMVWVGMGEYDDTTGTWTPTSNGVFAPDYQPYTLDTMYTDFLRGIDAMNPGELEITDITEDTSRLDQEEWTGNIRLSFTLEGQPQELELYSPGPWLDNGAMMQIAECINALDENKKLCFADDEGTGLLIFYRDRDWMMDFIRITRMPLCTDPAMLYN